MLVLADGTQINSEWELQDLLARNVGFDDWRHQKAELYRILSSPTGLADDVVSENAELKRDLDEVLSDREGMEDEICDLESRIDEKDKKIEDRNKQIRFLIDKVKSLGGNPFADDDGNRAEVMLDIAIAFESRQCEDAACA